MRKVIVVFLVALAFVFAVNFGAAQAQTIFYDDTVNGDVGGINNGEPFTELGTLPNLNGVYRITGRAGGAGQPAGDDQEAFNFTVDSSFNFSSEGGSTILELQWLWEGSDMSGAELGFFGPPFGASDPIVLTDLPAGDYSFRGFESFNLGPATRTWNVDIEINNAIPEPSTLVLALLGLVGLMGCRRKRRRRVA
jgi:hypothetical protein